MKREELPAIRIESQNLSGSVEHYYHFFFGLLVPLVNWYCKNGRNYAKVYVRSCADLDIVLLELDYKNVVILDRQKHLELAAQDHYEYHCLQHIKLRGYDKPDAYLKNAFISARNEILSRLEIVPDTVRNKIMSSNTEGRKTIIIDRKTPAKFFQSEYCEIQGGGNIRRSIPNIKQVEGALFEYHPSMVFMEGLSLKRQATIFHTADIIIAQHGAALSNLLFCRPGVTIVEIIPRNLIQDGIFSNYFRLLSRIIKAKHFIVLQHGSHSPVNISSLLNTLILNRSSFKTEILYLLYRNKRSISLFLSQLKLLIKNFCSNPYLSMKKPQHDLFE